MMLQVDSEAYNIGRNCGAAFGVLIPVLLIIKGVRSMTEPHYSRKCSLSLVVAAGGWAISSVAYGLRIMTDTEALLTLALVPAALAILAGLVIAVLGLIEVGSASDAKPLSGRGQAIGALVIGTIFMGAGVLGAVSGFSSIPKDLRLPPQTPGTTLTFAPKNFTFEVPSDDWIPLIPQKVNPDADLVYAHSKHQVYFVLIALNIPRGGYLTADKVAEVARKELQQTDPLGQVEEAQPESVGSFSGRGFSATLKGADGKRVAYRVWVFGNATHAYQMLTWGPEKSADQVRAHASELLRRFALLSP